MFVAFSVTLARALSAQETERAPRVRTIPPSHVDVPYGSHKRQVLDLYLATSEQPTPLVLFIHGGGFRQGDKQMLSDEQVRQFHAAGISVAAINYRLTDTAPMPAAYLDCARALQFLRHHASKWNLDPALVASTGGSAGAGTSLWIAFHDEMADFGSDDPVARESTRLVCVALRNAQCSYDPRFVEQLGAARPNMERHAFFAPFYGIQPGAFDTPEAHRLYEQAAPISFLTRDDPPVMITYTFRNEPITSETEIGAIIHHPLFGVRLKERMDALGIPCIIAYRGDHGQTVVHGQPDARPPDPVVFIREQFEARGRKFGVEGAPVRKNTTPGGQ